jgi:hypothetical protein
MEELVKALTSAKLFFAIFTSLLGVATAEIAMADQIPEGMPAVEFTSHDEALSYPTTNCGGAVVRAPRPNTQFANTLAEGSQASLLYQKAARYRAKWLTNVTCSETGITHQLGYSFSDDSASIVPGGIKASTINNSAWSGYNISNAAQYVQTGYTVPSSGPPGRPLYSSGMGYRASIWAGLGGGRHGSGYAGLPLVQSGSTVVWSESGVASYYSWFEVIGLPGEKSNERVISGITTHAGDDMGVVSAWTPATRGGTYTLTVCNFTVPTCVDLNLIGDGTTPPGQPQRPIYPPPGSSVEWVVEAPGFGGGVYPIANYGSLHMYNACWATVLGTGAVCRPLNDPIVQSPLYIQLQQPLLGRNQIVSYPLTITTPTNLYFTYQHPTKLN